MTPSAAASFSRGRSPSNSQANEQFYNRYSAASVNIQPECAKIMGEPPRVRQAHADMSLQRPPRRRRHEEKQKCRDPDEQRMKERRHVQNRPVNKSPPMNPLNGESLPPFPGFGCN